MPFLKLEYFFTFWKIISLGLALVFLDTFIYERYFVSFKEYEFRSNKVPKSFDGYKIAVVSDLHYGFLTPEFWIRNLVKKINISNFHLVVGLGDYVKKKRTNDELLTVWPILNTIVAEDGVFFINGNHDHWANHTLSLNLLEESKKSLRNRNIKIAKGKDFIILAGIGDFWEDKTPIDEALIDTSNKNLRIILAHNPDSADTHHHNQVDLFLTGHTHGGQIRIPIANISPILPVNNKQYDRGFKLNHKNETVFISPGIGWSILPIRFFCRSEIPIIVLKSQ